MCIFIRGERTIIRFLIGVISALVIGGIIISIPSTVRIVTGQSSALPTSVILEVPSGSEFNQSRPDLPPVAIYQLEPVIMPSNDNFLVLDTDLETKLTDQTTASALEPITDQLGDNLVEALGQPTASQNQLFQPQLYETRPILPSIAKNLDSSFVLSETPVKNPSTQTTSQVLDQVEYDGTDNLRLEDFNPDLPAEPSVPLLKANPIGGSVQKSND